MEVFIAAISACPEKSLIVRALLEMMNWLQWGIPYMWAMSYGSFTVAFGELYTAASR